MDFDRVVWLNLKFMYNVVLYKKEKIITVVNSFQKKLLLLVNPWERVFESEFAYKSRVYMSLKPSKAEALLYIFFFDNQGCFIYNLHF